MNHKRELASMRLRDHYHCRETHTVFLTSLEIMSEIPNVFTTPNCFRRLPANLVEQPCLRGVGLTALRC